MLEIWPLEQVGDLPRKSANKKKALKCNIRSKQQGLCLSIMKHERCMV
jgi:hypothetical protein